MRTPLPRSIAQLIAGKSPCESIAALRIARSEVAVRAVDGVAQQQAKAATLEMIDGALAELARPIRCRTVYRGGRPTVMA